MCFLCGSSLPARVSMTMTSFKRSDAKKWVVATHRPKARSPCRNLIIPFLLFLPKRQFFETGCRLRHAKNSFRMLQFEYECVLNMYVTNAELQYLCLRLWRQKASHFDADSVLSSSTWSASTWRHSATFHICSKDKSYLTDKKSFLISAMYQLSSITIVN